MNNWILYWWMGMNQWWIHLWMEVSAPQQLSSPPSINQMSLIWLMRERRKSWLLRPPSPLRAKPALFSLIFQFHSFVGFVCLGLSSLGGAMGPRPAHNPPKRQPNQTQLHEFHWRPQTIQSNKLKINLIGCFAGAGSIHQSNSIKQTIQPKQKVVLISFFCLISFELISLTFFSPTAACGNSATSSLRNQFHVFVHSSQKHSIMITR